MKRTATITRADLLARLEAATVPAGPINDIADVFDDPQVRHRNMRSDLPHPAAAGGSVPGLRTPIVLDGRPMRSEEHTSELQSIMRNSYAVFCLKKKKKTTKK